MFSHRLHITPKSNQLFLVPRHIPSKNFIPNSPSNPAARQTNQQIAAHAKNSTTIINKQATVNSQGRLIRPSQAATQNRPKFLSAMNTDSYTAVQSRADHNYWRPQRSLGMQQRCQLRTQITYAATVQ